MLLAEHELAKIRGRLADFYDAAIDAQLPKPPRWPKPSRRGGQPSWSPSPRTPPTPAPKASTASSSKPNGSAAVPGSDKVLASLTDAGEPGTGEDSGAFDADVVAALRHLAEMINQRLQFGAFRGEQSLAVQLGAEDLIFRGHEVSIYVRLGGASDWPSVARVCAHKIPRAAAAWPLDGR
jgi:hypothetical protein